MTCRAAGVVTLTVTEPLPAGETAVICVAELTVKLVAAVPPNVHRRCAGEVGAGDDDAGAAGSRSRRRRQAGDGRRRNVR